MQARLFEQLRVTAGASYVPETTLETSTTWPGYGYVEAAAEVPPDKVELFYDIMGRITADLKSRTVSQDELDRAKGPRVELFTKSQQTNGYWLNVLTGVQADPRKLDVIRTTIPNLRHVTAADVRRAAELVFDDGHAWKMEVAPNTPSDPNAVKPAEQSGVVTLDCALAGPKLSDCRVLREAPPGRGLGVEAVAMAAKATATANAAQAAQNGRLQFAVHLPNPDPSN
jgi:hypothetical protein